ncbi:MAG: tetratricopeptide repeat protein, partial [Hyphomonas sp.]|nr:tetratricopeptide repeat protein [Hyphomonas sp.]
MPSTVQTDAAEERLQRLLGFLREDPKNSALLLETAETAFEAKEAELAYLLADRLRGAGPVSPAQLGRLGLAALSAGAFGDAAGFYQEILDAGEADASVRFNLAYASAKEGRFDAALELLDEATA